jgi:hypothetical protein
MSVFNNTIVYVCLLLPKLVQIFVIFDIENYNATLNELIEPNILYLLQYFDVIGIF